jgi:hypothetical protein
MNTFNQTDEDILLTEVMEIQKMTSDLMRDIDNGHEPHGPYPDTFREDRGKRMTLKVARQRLHHIDFRLRELAKKYSET